MTLFYVNFWYNSILMLLLGIYFFSFFVYKNFPLKMSIGRLKRTSENRYCILPNLFCTGTQDFLCLLSSINMEMMFKTIYLFLNKHTSFHYKWCKLYTCNISFFFFFFFLFFFIFVIIFIIGNEIKWNGQNQILFYLFLLIFFQFFQKIGSPVL